MFNKLLIANRGEIACRIIRTARRLGLRTVAVYSDADAGAMHVQMADEAVHIGGSAPADSYLRGDVIIAAAQATGAGAIHPGYGFLSENPEFVDAVIAAGLIFVGPSADAIRAMGLKDAAKARMADAGVPVVPGYHGADQSPDVLASEAAKTGYPVMIKAVAGGGGKGMRIVDTPDGFPDALKSCQAEARSAFGNDAVLIEKYIQQPRHIELQVFGDNHGNVVHLYERDCSLQRRHQKVIEEAPAPGMTPDVRAAMGAAAVKAAAAINYSGAGTIEFIVDGAGGLKPDGFWFMEMNTRLQVEHPVTEAITGQDLVEWQLRVAAGERLPLTQDAIPLNGHAFEARLYAEDVPAGFLPATGTLSHLAFPDTARADTGVETGSVISPWYDPMIAKVITHGPSRAAALNGLARALDDTQIMGTVTNLGFLSALARHAGFANGDVDTGLIARDLDELTHVPEISSAEIGAAAIMAAGVWDASTDETGFTLWGPSRRAIQLEIDEKTYDIGLYIASGSEISFDINGADRQPAHRFSSGWQFGDTRISHVKRVGNTVSVFGLLTRSFTIPDPLDRATSAGAGAGITLAPMPGLVRDVLVVAGQNVQAGDRLAVLEAMKMEHSLTAARDGTVAEVLVTAGSQVDAGAPIIRLEEDT
jgi:3-methylcrotonyl-CoA carboxylase alpha subunit